VIFGARVLAATAALALLAACGSGSASTTAGANPSRTVAAGPQAPTAVSAVAPAKTTVRPPRPPRVTMRVVRLYSHGQRFRTYTGARPPAFSEAAALRRARGPNDYSLGLWDVGLVHEDSSVDWHSVWIIADQTFVKDIDRFVTRSPSAARYSEPPHRAARMVTVGHDARRPNRPILPCPDLLTRSERAFLYLRDRCGFADHQSPDDRDGSSS
jgi:hypothetical protein